MILYFSEIFILYIADKKTESTKFLSNFYVVGKVRYLQLYVN